MKDFSELRLSDEMNKALSTIQFETMTQIQEEAIPVIMDGYDVIGQSQTGTGKTAAFGIPAIEKIDVANRNVQVLILCPTRELATQIAEVFKSLAKFKKGLNVLSVYGGDSIERQIKELKRGCQVVIATPGRAMDHIRRNTLKLKNLKMVILDEADEMLNMGFEEDIQTILKDIDYPHQTVLFSATMPKRILDITKKYQTDPKYIKIKAETLTVSNIEQVYYETKSKMKAELLKRIIKLEHPNSAVVFCNTKRKVDELIEMFKGEDFICEALHGDIRQTSRERIMKKFKSGRINILIATDVAARGIDVDNLDIVFNYDLPQEHEYYVHRIGRTGRNGKSGKAISFVVGKEERELKEIERYAKIKIKAAKAPSISDVEKLETAKFTDEIKNIITDKKLKNQELVNLLVNEGYSFEEIANALASYIIKPTQAKEKTNEVKISNDGMVKLFLTVGKRDNIKVKDIVGAIASKTAITGKDIGKVVLLDSYSFIEIPAEYAEEVIGTMTNNQIKGKKVKIEVAENA